MAYTYDAALTKRSVGKMYTLSPILIGGAIYLAWLATVARRERLGEEILRLHAAPFE